MTNSWNFGVIDAELSGVSVSNFLSSSKVVVSNIFAVLSLDEVIKYERSGLNWISVNDSE